MKTPPADVCPDCGGIGQVTAGAPDCPSCGGTGDRPAVTDAEVEAAVQAYHNEAAVPPVGSPAGNYRRSMMRAALEAAAARQEKP